jgi:integrase
MRGDGLYRRGEVWWMTYVTPDGKRHQASTGQHYHEDAKGVRNRLVGDLASGRPVALPGKTTLAQLGELIVADYKTRKQRSVGRVKGALKPLTAYFGRQRVASISWGDTVKYRQHRQAEGLGIASINYELAILRRMLRLGAKDGKLAAVPLVETPDPKNARSGFFERADFEAVAKKLPEAYGAVARFAYLTGWRVRSEVLGLRWDQVDFAAGTVTIPPHVTKNGEPKLFPFDGLPELADLLRGRRAATNAVIAETGKRVPVVFHDGGHPIPYKKLLKAWHAAGTAAEVEGRFLHDFRRTAARNLRRAGVDEGTIMKLCGWQTRKMFDRYNIIDERDLRAGVQKLAGVTVELQSGQSEGSAAP